MTTTDKPTLCAAAVLAMCLVTACHEALGHGGACLATGGAIQLLSSSLFRCAPASPLVDAAGPVANLAAGALAWSAARHVRAPALRLLLVMVGALAWFWDSGYAARAMLMRDGDLYFGLAGAFGSVSTTVRVAVTAAGVGLYVATLRLARSALAVWPPGTGRTAWLAATLAALLAALVGAHEPLHGLRDAALEIGLASAPLSWMGGDAASEGLARERGLTVAAAVVFAAFVLLLGRGLPWRG